MRIVLSSVRSACGSAEIANRALCRLECQRNCPTGLASGVRTRAWNTRSGSARSGVPLGWGGGLSTGDAGQLFYQVVSARPSVRVKRGRRTDGSAEGHRRVGQLHPCQAKRQRIDPLASLTCHTPRLRSELTASHLEASSGRASSLRFASPPE